VRELAEGDHLLDYRASLQDDKVVFRNRMSTPPKAETRYPVLDPEAFHRRSK
jgi:hypothetical protein